MAKLFISEFDPVSSSEGSLDPLGLTLIADRLAGKLVSGFRERMSHPRFLTLIAIGNHLCKKFGDDRIASDGVSEPWQVYEWFVVQALVKKFYGTEEIKGLPGSDKTFRAFKSKLPLSAGLYLKTPSVFGFNGVYRTLSTNLDIVKEGILGENGDKLLRIWEEEQGLTGFYMDGQDGGRNFRNRFSDAINDGLNKGEVSRPWSWSFFDEMAGYLSIYKAGKREKKFLSNLLMRETECHRKEIIELLINYGKSKNIKANEKLFHDFALINSGEELKYLLNTIQLYEEFARLMTNAFSEVLYLLSRTKRLEKINILANDIYVSEATKTIPEIYNELYERLNMFGEGIVFEENLSVFNNKVNTIDFTRNLIEHHFKVQDKKPPNGKLHWLDHLNNDSFMIRTIYTKDEAVYTINEYIHPYRYKPLISFLKDLSIIDT